MSEKLKIKKSQISIFIIIGIILIIVSVFLLTKGNYNIFVSHDSKLKNQVSDVVKNCIEKNANEGVFLLGAQGGYINVNSPNYKIPGTYINIGFKIPDWDSNTGKIPTIKSMQNELNNYILNHSTSCIVENLKEMRKYFNISIDGKLRVNSTINPDNVVILAQLPIKFNEKNSKNVLSIQNYYVKLDPLRLGTMFNLASEIFNLEASTNFLEELTLDQIESASDYSHPSMSMPSEGMTISCAPRYWTIPELKRTLANLNNNNFRYIQFEGTYPKTMRYNVEFNKKDKTKQYEKYYQKYYTFKLPNEENGFKSIMVNIVMPSEEVINNSGYFEKYPYRVFKVTPSFGMIVKPIKMKIPMTSKIPIPCIQIYHELYTLDYDLVVSLVDYSSDGGHYTFRFPLRVVIKDNNPKQYTQQPILGQRPTATNEKFCSNQSRKYRVPVFVTDANTGDLLSGVNISYKCINLECNLGSTHKSTNPYAINSQPKLDTKFPFCFGGSIIASKKGYATKSYRPDKDPYKFGNNSISYYEISLIPTKTFALNRFTFYSYYIENKMGHRVYEDSNEEVYISIENKKNNFESDAIFPSDKRFEQLTFLKGKYKYNVSIIYVDANGDLRGMYEKQNVLLNPESGNTIRIIFPSSTKKIDDKSYLSFYKTMNELSKSGKFGIFFD